MSSAIGNYIHFMTSNYTKYGVGKKSANFKLMPFETYKKQRLKNIQEVSQEAVGELEKRLKENLESQENADAQLINKEVQKRNDYIFEILKETTSTEALQKFMNGNHFQPSGGNIEGVTKTTAELKNLRDKVQEFKAIMKTFQESTTMRTDTFRRRAERMITLYNEITNSTETMISDKDISTRNKKSVLQKVNAASLNTSFNTTQSALRGASGEYLLAACDDNIKKLSRKKAKNFMQEAVQGENRSDIQISTDTFEGLDTDQIKFFSQALQDGSTITFGSSQDKVDVKITVGGEEILASVKNYNLA